MSTATEHARQYYAEELRVTANLKSTALVEALARVPRERFLGPGPWIIRGTELDAGPRRTDDGDPKRVYHNVSIAVDAGRDLYNGQPGLIAAWIDSLGIAPGHRVLHVGCGTGYYTALIAATVGPAGRVWAVEVDADLAGRARANLAEWPWVEVQQGDGRTGLPAGMDAVLVHAGATHVLDEWLDAVRDGGRLLVPLTVSIPAMGSALSKGVVLMARRAGDEWSARLGSMVAIYSLVGLRDDAMNQALGKALMAGPASARVTRLRRDPHDPAPSCWMHATTAGVCCISA